MNNKKIKEFIKEKSYLFWWIKEREKENISINFLVEQILNYGDCSDVKKLFDLVGIEKVAEIFYRQTSRRRINYHLRTMHYFDLYFKKHAPKNSIGKSINTAAFNKSIFR